MLILITPTLVYSLMLDMKKEASCEGVFENESRVTEIRGSSRIGQIGPISAIAFRRFSH